MREAAFGRRPGARVRVRLEASAAERWQVAVALGGQGRYAGAATILGKLLADPAVPAAVAAHAAVTLAAHRRQLGGHAAARRYDALGLRLACAAGPGVPDPDGTDACAARIDALVGLAADAVGTLDHSGAQRCLDAAAALGDAHPSWRPVTRAGWVRAELALLRGDAADALDPARQALAAARAGGSVRHVLKSRIVLAVADAAAGGDPAAAVAELDAAGGAAERHGLLPLTWPARLATADLLDRFPGLPVPRTGGGGANERADGTSHRSVRDRSRDAPRRRHAAMATLSVIEGRTDPIGNRLMGESVWLPRRLRVT
ncbi:hypothetical protein [Pseudonocardia nigra]|uniref:hypothetical protein n=1 Tax=Pseudonocardia nigra TaxID=1921578 RepID=UPI001C5DC08D|nr:hypothetical protein [Pseudonocardia nigra]